MFRTRTEMPLIGEMSRNKILLTGSTGVIGNYATRQLLENGFEVIAVSRSGKGPAGVALDVQDPTAVREFMSRERPEYLLHLAWNVGPGYEESPDNLEWVVASLNLLQIFAESDGRRAVFTGTCFEYEWKSGIFTEDETPLEASRLYGVAKSSLYKLSSAWSKNINLSFAWGRVFFLYGRGERDSRIVPYIVDSLLKGEKPALKFPYISRDYMHAGDIAGGLIALLMSDFNGAVNIASGSAVPLCSIAKKAAKLLNLPEPEYQQVNSKAEIPIVIADTRRLNSVVGFQPKISWETGLSEMIEWRKSLLMSKEA